MRKNRYLFFQRRLTPQTFMTGAGIVFIIVFILFAVIVFFKPEQNPPGVVVSPPPVWETAIDRSGLSVLDSLEYPIKVDSKGTILRLGMILTFTFSPDWDRLVTGCNMGVFIWDITEDPPRLLKWLRNQDDIPNALAFSPDSRLLAQGNDGGTLTLWEQESGEILFHIRAYLNSTITKLVFSPDGSLLVTGDAVGRVKIWDTETGKRIGQLNEQEGGITALSFTPDGRYLLVGGAQGNTVTVWEWEKNRMILSKRGGELAFHPYDLNLMTPSALFSPDGKRILSQCVSSATQPFVLWDVSLNDANGKIERETHLIQSATGQSIPIQYQNISFSPDGKYVMTAWEQASLWDAETGARICAYPKLDGAYSHVAFSPDGWQFVTFNWRTHDFTFRELETGKVIRSFELHSNPSKFTLFMPDGRHILCGSDTGVTYIRDLESGRVTETYSLKTNEPQRVFGYSSDRQRLLSEFRGKPGVLFKDRKNECYVWDLQSGEKIQTFKGYKSYLRSCVMTRDGSKVIGAGVDGDITIWDAETGEIIESIQEKKSFSIEAFALSPTGESAAVILRPIKYQPGSQEHIVNIWDIQTGELICTTKYISGSSSPLLFFPDGRSILTGIGDRYLQIFSIENEESREIQYGRNQFSNSAAISPDGKYLVGSGYGGRLIFLNLETPQGVINVGTDLLTGPLQSNPGMTNWKKMGTQFIYNFPQSALEVQALDFSPDGKRLLLSGSDGNIQIWNLSNILAPAPAP